MKQVCIVRKITETKFLLANKEKHFFVSVFAVFKGCYQFLKKLKSIIW